MHFPSSSLLRTGDEGITTVISSSSSSSWAGQVDRVVRDGGGAEVGSGGSEGGFAVVGCGGWVEETRKKDCTNSKVHSKSVEKCRLVKRGKKSALPHTGIDGVE